MLKSIVIKNIQSHKKTIIKLVKGVNVIVGKTQAGKTAILRALDLVRTNRPSGSRFVRHGESEASVTIRTMEGGKVTLKKTPTQRIYTVNGSKFRKFGTAVPEEVDEVLRMSDINIQTQLDSPFLVTSTGAEITKTINRITKAEKVDKWIKLANKKVNDLTRQKAATTTELREIKEKISALAGVPEMSKTIKKAHTALSQEGRLTEKWSSVESRLRELEERQKELEKIEGICLVESKVNGIVERKEKVVKLNEEILLINRFTTRFRRNKSLTLKITHLDTQSSIYDEITWQIAGINETILRVNSFVEAVQELKTTNKEVDHFKSEYIEEMKTEGICPTCFGEVDEDAIERIESAI